MTKQVFKIEKLEERIAPAALGQLLTIGSCAGGCQGVPGCGPSIDVNLNLCGVNGAVQNIAATAHTLIADVGQTANHLVSGVAGTAGGLLDCNLAQIKVCGPTLNVCV